MIGTVPDGCGVYLIFLQTISTFKNYARISVWDETYFYNQVK